MNLNLASILAFLTPFEAILNPLVLNLDTNTIQPELKTLIAGVTSPDLKLLLTALDTAIDGFAQAELAKLG